mmetsp:Transcript_24325/g.58710  ORF Transcript_24325/g.58710 Transcript_24325/m.58710 type:complete len:92 (-) Transcript_24325:599-874(-)
MNNWFPGKEATEYDSVYDIKGCDDDKKIVEKKTLVPVRRNRWFTPPYQWPFFSQTAIDERKIYKEGKIEAKSMSIPLNKKQRQQVLRILDR